MTESGIYTVAELIAELQNMDPFLVVAVGDWNEEYTAPTIHLGTPPFKVREVYTYSRETDASGKHYLPTKVRACVILDSQHTLVESRIRADVERQESPK